jgi:hypothetical protein
VCYYTFCKMPSLYLLCVFQVSEFEHKFKSCVSNSCIKPFCNVRHGNAVRFLCISCRILKTGGDVYCELFLRPTGHIGQCFCG